MQGAEVLEAVSRGNLDMLRDNINMLESVRDEAGNNPLLIAVRCGSIKTVVSLVKDMGAELAYCNNAGMSCLHMAAERSDARATGGEGGHGRAGGAEEERGSAAAMLSVLLDDLDEAGTLHVDTRDKQNFTPLHVACMCGDVSAARCLLRHGADVGAVSDKGSTAVHWACSRGHTKVVKLLVGMYGAEFAVPAGNGSTPLHWAASKNRRAIIRLLVGTYCAQVDVRDDKGCTPTLIAALNGHIQAVELLADRFGAKVTTHDKRRTNLLHAACEMGHADMATFLIERYHMSVEEPDRRGLTPLARASLRNHVDVFRRLVDKHGARLDALTCRSSSLLHVASEGGAVDCARLLLHDYGFDVNGRNADGDTPALIAASRGHADILALLVQNHGASLDAADARGAGALHKACQGKQPAAAATILLESYGVPADSADPNGTTPLHLAARGGDASLAELLTGPTGRADPGMKDGEGNQPLHIAAACGHLDVVKVMVEKAGADLGARNASEKSALDVAVQKANTDIADYLRAVLPDGGEHHDRCQRRAGFKRAGRWMGLGRAAGYIQDLSLEHVYLLPVPTLLGLGRFPSQYDASRKKLLVRASDVPPHAQVLMVSHPSELPGNPDPSGRQFSALKEFLRYSTEENMGGDEDGEANGTGFGYVWAAFSCTSSNRIKPTFKTHLHNLVTAYCFADHLLVLPATVTVRHCDGFACTDLMGYAENGWCGVELLCTWHLGVPTTLYLALADGSSAAESGTQVPNGGLSPPTSSTNPTAPMPPRMVGGDEQEARCGGEAVGNSSNVEFGGNASGTFGDILDNNGDNPSNGVNRGDGGVDKSQTTASFVFQSLSPPIADIATAGGGVGTDSVLPNAPLSGSAPFQVTCPAANTNDEGETKRKSCVGEEQCAESAPESEAATTIDISSCNTQSGGSSLNTPSSPFSVVEQEQKERQEMEGSSSPSLGRSISRAVECAAKSLTPFYTAAVEKIDPERAPTAVSQYQKDEGYSADFDDGENRTLTERQARSALVIPGAGEHSPVMSGEGQRHGQQHRHHHQQDEPGEKITTNKDGDSNSDNQAENDVFAVADLLWSADAETHLDNISAMVATLLQALHDEASRFIPAAETVPSPPPPPLPPTQAPKDPGARTATAAEVDSGSPRGGVSSCRHGVAGDPSRNSTEEPKAVPPLRNGEMAARLLGRILTHSLGKHDVEDEVAGVGVGQKDEGVTMVDVGEGERVAAMLRQVHEELGSFANGIERVEALNTLLLTACYFKGISSVTGGTSGSPKRVHRGACTPTTPPSPSASGSSASGQRSRLSNSPGDGGRKRAVEVNQDPHTADSVPSCRVS